MRSGSDLTNNSYLKAFKSHDSFSTFNDEFQFLFSSWEKPLLKWSYTAYKWFKRGGWYSLKIISWYFTAVIKNWIMFVSDCSLHSAEFISINKMKYIFLSFFPTSCCRCWQTSSFRSWLHCHRVPAALLCNSSDTALSTVTPKHKSSLCGAFHENS